MGQKGRKGGHEDRERREDGRIGKGEKKQWEKKGREIRENGRIGERRNSRRKGKGEKRKWAIRTGREEKMGE